MYLQRNWAQDQGAPWSLSLCFHQLADLFQVTQALPVILTNVWFLGK